MSGLRRQRKGECEKGEVGEEWSRDKVKGDTRERERKRNGRRGGGGEIDGR